MITQEKRSPTWVRGRFAPSPSGLLHFGSLVTALASFLNIKSKNGAWLVRIEDIDPPREQLGASDNILKTLELFGLHWDEDILYQSQQTSLYFDVLSDLAAKNLTYYCQCTRATIKVLGGIYQGQCRHLKLPSHVAHSNTTYATRIINKVAIDHYSDLIQGNIYCNQALAKEDFILVRKDGLFAYQLAVVVDDIYQNITEVIRGCDLIEPTARQLSLFTLLQQAPPQYGHVPLVITPQGYKLSKQNKAPAIDINHPQSTLVTALQFLGQKPPAELKFESIEQIINWAIKHWSLNSVPKKTEIPFSPF